MVPTRVLPVIVGVPGSTGHLKVVGTKGLGGLGRGGTIGYPTTTVKSVHLLKESVACR